VTNPEPTRAAPTPLVRCIGITKYFGGVRALDAVSLDLMPGEIVALVGDNGAGKSTLVKILSGIYQADEGSIWLGDVKVPQLNPKRAREFGIETVYQHLFLCDNLGATANVMLGQEPVRYRIGPLQILDQRRALDEARQHIAELGIDLADLNSPVRRLSGGQRQAIAIARATVKAHRLIQFDEPTAALGVRQTKATLALIQRVAARGVAVIMISHNLDDVFALAERVVVLRLGRIALDTSVAATTREQVVACMTGMSFRRDAL
jgi:ABC-type sugar transport system ATPase subunit